MGVHGGNRPAGLFLFKLYAIAIILIATGCAYSPKLIHDKPHTVYVVRGDKDDLLTRFAPAFLTYHHVKSYNRIGRPSALVDEKGGEQIYVDHHNPAVYAMMSRFSGRNGIYTNLIYRIHFSKVPFSIIPFHLTAGKNAGLLVVVTIDAHKRPLLVTTVGTCGCYVAVAPTTHLSVSAFPEDWRKEPLKVYGERLPPLLDFKGRKCPALLVHLRSAVHRVMHLEVVEEERLKDPETYAMIEAPLMPMEALEHIPINGGNTSFFYDRGLLKGHVKGSVKPWETLLMSLISLDLFVGADKVFGNSSST
ncbi:MAG: hypothetical protein GY849_05815, partial [Deltaproteobacteria bacterium]|nr:hypothetical protein [Deltaproteobacteria bacterium]